MRIDQIMSSSNGKFQTWKSLLTAKGIKKEKLFLLSGEKLVREFLKTSGFEISCELITKNLKPLQASKPVFELDTPLFKELDSVGTGFNLFIVGVPEISEITSQEKAEGLEVVAPLGDPKNLGALIRTCVAFGVKKVILTKESAHPFHPQCVKASAGAVLKAPLFQGAEILSWDQSNAWALDSEGEALDQITKPSNIRLIVGEEGPGLKGFSKVKRVSIPTQDVESLNATVAASLVIWTWK